MRWTPIPVIGGSYADDTRPWTNQDCCNWLLVKAEQEGTRSQAILRSPPGLKEFISFGAGPHRGARNVEGKLFVVADTHLYQIISATEVLQLGEIPGRSIVSMSHNQITNGNQLVIATGADGYCYNTVTQVFEKITDDAFPGSRVFDYINSLIIGIEPQRRFFFNSDLADALAYNDIERYESEASPDRLVTLIVSHLEVWVFNQKTTEVFDNTSDPTSIANHILFVNKRVAIDLGAASAHSVVTLDNAIFVVGSDGSGYRMDGYTPVRITTHAIEQAWARCDLSKCFCFTWSDRGHKVWYITFPDGFTWGYDCSSGEWHRRASVGRDRWRLNTMVEWNGDWYGGSYNSGMFYKLDWDYMMEGCDEMVSRRVTGVLHDDGNVVTVPGIRLEFDTGGETTVCEEVTPIPIPGDTIILGGSNSIVRLNDSLPFDPDAWTAGTCNGYQPGRFVGSGGEYLAVNTTGGTARIFYVSSDRSAWTSGTISPGDGGSSLFSAAVNADHSRWVVGDDSGYLWSSPDRVTWTQNPDVSEGAFYCGYFADGLFVFPDTNGGISTSPDGLSPWTTAATAANNFYQANFANGLHLAATQNGTCYTSPDGLAPWISHSTGLTNNLKPLGIAYGDGLHLILGKNGEIAYSTDAAAWTKTTIPTASGTYGTLVYGNGVFVASTGAFGSCTVYYGIWDGAALTWATTVTGGEDENMSNGSGLLA
jgi:hypothetical protein